MARFRALLIDDEEELVSTIVERLSYRGVEADYALTGPVALEMLREKPFDVVVLDLKLPGMSGLEVLKNIRKEHARLPVLLITGHGSPVNQIEKKPEEAYDFLAKPIDLEALIDKMEEAIKSV
jgi:two-component system OmpR family response regulator